MVMANTENLVSPAQADEIELQNKINMVAKYLIIDYLANLSSQ